MDALARAYATLELPPQASAPEVKKRFRLLVKRWHPDQWSGDAQGQAEAAVRMREINDAYRRITAHLAGAGHAEEPPADAPHHAAPGHRLSREEIDRIVASLGTDGPMDWLLGLGRGRRLEGRPGMIDVEEFHRRAKIAAGLTAASCAAVCLVARANGVDPFPGPAFLLN